MPPPDLCNDIICELYTVKEHIFITSF